jgi:hypothetical protein
MRTGLSSTFVRSFAGICILLAAISLVHQTMGAWTGTDEEFVHTVESNNWEYFFYNQAGPFRMFSRRGGS